MVARTRPRYLMRFGNFTFGLPDSADFCAESLSASPHPSDSAGKLAVRLGFEPRQRPPKGLVLPLHYRTKLPHIVASRQTLRKGKLRHWIAARLRRETTMTLAWIAERLWLGSSMHPAHLLYWPGKKRR